MLEYYFLHPNEVTPQNLVDINSLLHQLSPQIVPLTKEKLLHVCANARMLVAKETASSKLVGMATLMVLEIASGKSGRVEDVSVDESARRLGIGRKLLQGMIDEAVRLGVEKIDLTSNPSRIGANKLYQSMDFEQVETNVYRLRMAQK